MKARASHIWGRQAQEWYVEPERCTHQLAAAETFIGAIHDPSCGGGNVVKALLAEGYPVTGSDIVERGAPAFAGVADFLSEGYGLWGAHNCVMNPPYSKGAGIEAFIIQALSLAPGKVCAFVPLRFLTSERRAKLFYRWLAPDRVWIVTPRPSCPPGEYLALGNVASGDTKDYAWLVWDERRGGARLGWLIDDSL